MTATPFWTTARFTLSNALDDLGIEAVGPTLMRRLLPGVLGATLNAGYYAFYTYLLWKFEHTSDLVLKRDFKPFFRRQEAAFAVACAMHDHRGALRGVQGIDVASVATWGDSATIDVADVSARYLAQSLGGLSAIYAQPLAAVGLTQPGRGQRVDRVTELGERVARAFAEVFESTSYYREEFEADHVSRDALARLGEACCLCCVPGRSDHELLLDVFLGRTERSDPAWQESVATRRSSVAMFLENHRQRPDGMLDTQSFRSLLLDWQYPDGSPFEFAHAVTKSGWSAYQLHQCVVRIFTSLWARYLQLLDDADAAAPGAFERGIAETTDWGVTTHEATTSTRDAIDAHARRGVDGAEIVARLYDLDSTSNDHAREFALAFDALLAIVGHAHERTDIPQQLMAEGGDARWSTQHVLEWFDARGSEPIRDTFAALLEELRFQHYRVAATKLTPGGTRDPYCCSEEDGLLRFIRDDEPFWTDPRYATMGHLLWTLGLVDQPAVAGRPTELGLDWLQEHTPSDG